MHYQNFMDQIVFPQMASLTRQGDVVRNKPNKKSK